MLRFALLPNRSAADAPGGLRPGAVFFIIRKNAQEVQLVEHWESLCPGGYRFVYDDALFPPGTDTFLLSSLPRLRPGLRVCDLGAGTGLLGLLLLQQIGRAHV